MKKMQILFATAVLVAGLGMAAAADGCGSSCCKQQGLKQGWFTGAGNLTKAACTNHVAGHCCDSKAGGACCESKADAKAGGSCCQSKGDAKAGSCCNGGQAGAQCSGGKCSGDCKK
ncbi:hypothetical protein IV102_26420 [bacterium]|nr:hypothetical protein [bacterium]